MTLASRFADPLKSAGLTRGDPVTVGQHTSLVLTEIRMVSPNFPEFPFLEQRSRGIRMVCRNVVLSLAAALAIVAALWFSAGQRSGNVLFILFWPAFAIAIVLSGNPHDLNTAVVFIAAVLEVFAAILLVIGGIRVARRLRLPRANDRPP